MVSDAEKKLISLVKEIDSDKGFMIGVCLAAREFAMVDELVSFINNSSNLDGNDIISFLFENDNCESSSDKTAMDD